MCQRSPLTFAVYLLERATCLLLWQPCTLLFFEGRSKGSAMLSVAPHNSTSTNFLRYTAALCGIAPAFGWTFFKWYLFALSEALDHFAGRSTNVHSTVITDNKPTYNHTIGTKKRLLLRQSRRLLYKNYNLLYNCDEYIHSIIIYLYRRPVGNTRLKNFLLSSQYSNHLNAQKE